MCLFGQGHMPAYHDHLKSTETNDQNTSLSVHYLSDNRVWRL